MMDKGYKGSWRQKIWQHNSFFGHVAMGKAHMRGIINSSTATQAAKEIAEQIYRLHLKLGEQLTFRVDTEQEKEDANPR